MSLETDICRTFDAYLERYPAERANLAPIVDALDAGTDVASRSTFPGHVTASAVVTDDDGRFLLIRHRTLERWLFPGGHLEAGDATVRDGALRELREETGVAPSALRPFGAWYDALPVYVDRHAIPGNPAKHEPAHEHYDARFVFRGSPHAITLQQEEVTDAGWKDASSLDGTLLARLRQLGIVRT
jgi:8-oxo-dGTP pyrophosphatase MutT (NUDIX family)